MVSIKTINSPSQGVVNILLRKINDDHIKDNLQKGLINSLGLIQGQLSEIIVAGDVVEKASNVNITEITGMCPQPISVIGVFGDTASVSEALKAVDKELNKDK